MKNCEIKKTGTILTISIDLAQSAGPSKSGKSLVIGTTEGNKGIGDGVFVGVNVYRRVE